MSFGPIVIDPNGKEFLSIYWGDRFSSISGGTWTISPTGPTLSGATVIGSTSTGVFVEPGGSGLGTIYSVACKATSSDGQVDERAIVFRCENM